MKRSDNINRETVIKNIPIKEIITFEITEDELESLRKGQKEESEAFSIANSLLSILTTLLLTYITCTFPSEFLKGLYISICFIFIIILPFSYIRYRRYKKSSDNIYNKIKKRMN